MLFVILYNNYRYKSKIYSLNLKLTKTYLLIKIIIVWSFNGYIYFFKLYLIKVYESQQNKVNNFDFNINFQIN